LSGLNSKPGIIFFTFKVQSKLLFAKQRDFGVTEGLCENSGFCQQWAFASG